jgi:hypothetical protein
MSLPNHSLGSHLLGSLQERFNLLVSHVVADAQLHARWINTFSFLEYVGFRKIVKSQQAETLTAAVLAHAMEEGRHAMSLKKLALKIGGPAYNTYAPHVLLCGSEAEDYFQTLDHSCDQALQELGDETRAALVYLYVTWLIEIRALDVYSRYRKALDATLGAQALDGLLAEEEQHLSRVAVELQKRDPEFATRSTSFVALEEQLFETLLNAFEKQVATTAMPSLVLSA